MKLAETRKGRCRGYHFAMLTGTTIASQCLLIGALALASLAAQVPARTASTLPDRPASGLLDAMSYTNPVGGDIRMGDPFVLRHEGMYYLFGTTNPSVGFRCWQSRDLVQWSQETWAFRRDSDSWGTRNLWAPEVIAYRGRFYMTYSAQHDAAGEFRLCLAEAQRPEGPYREIAAPWIDTGRSSIDAHLFVDEDRRVYLYFTRVGVRDGEIFGQTYGMRISQDLLQGETEPVLCVKAEQTWEEPDEKRSRCNEGPFVFRRGGIYYMTYSAGHYQSPRYAIGYATARSPLGPWTKPVDNPLVARNDKIGISGPGHSCMVLSPDGKEMFIVYHTHGDPAKPGASRVVCIDRADAEAGRLTIRGPTRTPQSLPSGASN